MRVRRYVFAALTVVGAVCHNTSGQDDSSAPAKTNIRHYMTANFEFFAEEPDWNGNNNAVVRQRIYIMPHIYLSKYDGVTLYLAGDTTIDRLVDAVVWGTPLPGSHPLASAVPSQSLLEQIRKSDSSAGGLGSTVLSEYQTQEKRDRDRNSVYRSEASRVYNVLHSAEVDHSARVWFSTAPPLLTDVQRQEILSAIYNIDPLLGGDRNHVYSTLSDGAEFTNFNRFKSHSFEYLAPRNFSADIRVDSSAEPVDRMTSVGAVAGRSSFGFYLDTLGLSELERIGRGHFSINVRGQVDLSRVQELVASFNFEAFSEQLYENFFSRRIVTESKSGRRWLKKYTKTSVETHVQSEQRKASTSDLATSISIRSRDWTDPVLLDRMYDFVFPKSETNSVETLIAKHIAAAESAQDPETKKLHQEYVKHLQTIAAKNYDELQASEDEFKNSIADAQNDEKKKAIAKAIVSLLQTGFGGNLDTSNSYLEIRELRTSEYYESRSRTFSAMMFESTEAGISVSKSRFLTAPIEVTRSHDLQGHIETLLRMRTESILGPIIYPAAPTPIEIPPQPLRSIEPTWPFDPWGPYRKLIRDGIDMTPIQENND